MLSKAQMDRKRKAELQKLCEENGLDTSGVKQELIDRLSEFCGISDQTASEEVSLDLGTMHKGEESSLKNPLEQSTDSLVMMISKMMESQSLMFTQLANQQKEDRNHQKEDRKMFLELMKR